MNQIDIRKDTALHVACRRLLDILSLLLDQGAAIDLKNAEGETPLAITLRKMTLKL